MTFEDHGITVTRTSGQIKTICPQCSDSRRKTKDPCLSVDIDQGVWNCHHCGWKGGLKKKTYTPAPSPRPTAKPRAPETDLPQKVLEWFAKRGIPPAVLKRNHIGYEKVFMPGAGKEVNAIAFPYFRDGQLVNVKHRDGEKNFRQTSGAEKILFGLDDITDDYTIFVEGEIDKLSLEAAGYSNCVSVPDGAPSPSAKNYDNKFSYLANCEKELKALKRIIIAVDSDAPGRKLEAELIRRLGPERCWRVAWPEGGKDANEVLVRHGAPGLAECISTASPVPVEGLFTVRDISTEIDTLYEKGTERGLSTGWMALDEYFTVRPGEMTIVTGIPSHGKSELIDAMAVNLAEEEGWRFAVFSPENYPLQRHFAKLASKYMRAPFFDGPTPRITPEGLRKGKEFIGEHFYFIAPPDSELSLEGILGKARAAVMRYGIRGLIIDPWNEVDHTRPAGLTETEYISQSLTKVRRFARMYGVHVWLIAHPAKMQKDMNGNYPVPTPYDISGSAHWRNKADNVISVWRDLLDDSKGVEVHVGKVRFREVGQPGMAKLTYDKVEGRYF